jgi:hypothetical protein
LSASSDSSVALRVDAVQLIQIDMIKPLPPETILDALFQVLLSHHPALHAGDSR